MKIDREIHLTLSSGFLLKLMILLSHQMELVEVVAPFYQVETRLCSHDQYYKQSGNGNGTCHRCSVCPRGYEVTHQCTDTSDTVCSLCPSDTHNNVRGGTCKPCSVCKQGQYRRRRCQPKRDSVCKRCPHRTYSTRSNVGACRYCTTCRPNEKKKRVCTRQSDTVCGDCQKGYFREFGSGFCMACSECPLQYSHRVATECRDAAGIHHPKICWPSGGSFFSLDTKTVTTDADDIGRTKDVENTADQGNHETEARIVLIFSTVVCVMFVIILSLALIIRVGDGKFCVVQPLRLQISQSPIPGLETGIVRHKDFAKCFHAPSVEGNNYVNYREILEYEPCYKPAKDDTESESEQELKQIMANTST